MKDCIFDLYGTLVDIHTEEAAPELWEKLAAEYARFGVKFAPTDLQKQYLHLVQQEEAAMRAARPECTYPPEIRLENVFRELFAMGGFSADSETVNFIGRKFREFSTEYIRLYDGVPELMKALRDAGKGIWLLSNAQRLFTAWELDHLGLTDCFDGIYLSSDYGCKKPDPHFFRTLLEEHQIAPESAIMVGNDGTCDIAGAKTVGLHTLYIRSNISPVEELPDADYVLPEMNITRVQEILLQN